MELSLTEEQGAPCHNTVHSFLGVNYTVRVVVGKRSIDVERLI